MGRTRRRATAGLLLALALGLSAVAPLPGASGDPGGGSAGQRDVTASELAAALDAHIEAVNSGLEAQGAEVRLYAAEAFTLGIGQIRIGNRFKKYWGHRWVPGDVRREAAGNTLRYVVDQSDGATLSGLSNAETEAALDRAVTTWSQEDCLDALPLTKAVDTGVDPDFLDGQLLPDQYLSGGTYAADIVLAGWYPTDLFLAFVPVFGSQIIAFSETYVFVDPETGQLTDVNRDSYVDTAFNEIYFQDGTQGQVLDWAVDLPTGAPGWDVETIALHEFGHSLGLGHFGPPPLAIMNPSGLNRPGRPHTFPSDSSAICSLFASWPRP